MRQMIEKGHDFRIIPENFESAAVFEVKNVNDDDFEIELKNSNADEQKDYKINSEVEIFGSGPQGLIFFVSKVIEQNGGCLKVAMPKNCKNIQRREYSRVVFYGKVELEGQNDNIISVVDISAGGLRLITKEPLEAAKDYKLKINLANNIAIDCLFHPVRIQEETVNENTVYAISGCYKDIASIDRVALVQYSFKVLLEAENKENER